jgi:hypothetical protein
MSCTVTMSRTYRNTPEDTWFRKPKTKRERTQNAGLEIDQNVEFEYSIAKQNRRHRYIPSDWDDLPISG